MNPDSTLAVIKPIANKIAAVSDTTAATNNINLTVGVNGNLDKIAGSFSNTVELVNNIFTAIANKIGSTSDHLWQVLIYQQKIEAITKIIIIGFTFLIGFSSGLYALFSKRNFIDIKENFTRRLLFAIVGAIFSLIFIILTMTLSNKIITGLMNPEYSALQYILALIKNPAYK
jgi:hypothetical protein